MAERISHCLGMDGDNSCAEDVTTTIPVPLCTRHRVQVARSVTPEMLASEGDLTSVAVAVQPDFSGPHDPRVYFVVNGDMVKIGLTTNLKNRLHRLGHPRGSVALLLNGGRSLEASLHHRFADFRVPDSEWFRRTAEINDYVVAKLGALPEPMRQVPNAAPDDAALVAALHKAAAPHVYLADVAAELGLTKTEARERVEGIGIAVRRAVRNGESTGVGVHKDDLPPLTTR